MKHRRLVPARVGDLPLPELAGWHMAPIGGVEPARLGGRVDLALDDLESGVLVDLGGGRFGPLRVVAFQILDDTLAVPEGGLVSPWFRCGQGQCVIDRRDLCDGLLQGGAVDDTPARPFSAPRARCARERSRTVFTLASVAGFNVGHRYPTVRRFGLIVCPAALRNRFTAMAGLMKGAQAAIDDPDEFGARECRRG